MKQQINLFQPTSHKFSSNKPRQLLSANVLLLGTIGLSCLVLMIIYASAYQKVSTLREELQHLSTQNRAVEQHLAKLRRTSLSKPAQSQNSDNLETEMNQLSARIEANTQLIEILQAQSQGNISGFSTYLEGLVHQSIEGIQLTKTLMRAGGTAITLTGKTRYPELVPNFITALSQESAFQQVDFQQIKLERSDKKQSFTFVLDATTNSEENIESYETIY